MDFVTQQTLNVLKKTHEHHNDTTGNTPIPELPHHSGVEKITASGERTLWIVFGIMTVSSILFMFFTLRQQKKLRLFPGHITVSITTAAAISYFAMAVHAGRTFVSAPGHNAVREIYYARYVDWAVTTPLLLLDLSLFAGLSFVDIGFLVVADMGMILTGLFAALDNGHRTRFGFYTFSCLFFIYVLYVQLVTATKTAYARSDKLGKAYLGIAVYTAVLWIGYPIVWALCEGVNYLDSDTEVLLYGILDVAAKPGFGLLLFSLHASMPSTNVALSSYWTEPAGPISGGGYGAISQNE